MYPPEVRGALANMKFVDNDEMVEAADNFMEKYKKRPGEVCAVQSDEQRSGAEQVDAISKGHHRPGKGHAKSTNPGAGTADGPGRTCFFHDRHGPAAFKCKGPPCPFSSLPLAKPAGNGTAGR